MSHEGLDFKLEQNGISGNILKLFQHYLNNRKQRVVVNGSFSEYSSIESGVPQGSILDPLLFLIYINDLQKILNRTSIVLLLLFSIVKDPDNDLGVINK